MILKGLNSIKADAYFIRLTDVENYYVHFTAESKDNLEYTIKEGLVGAAIFTKANAKNFIKHSRAHNLERVPVTKVLPPDGSSN